MLSKETLRLFRLTFAEITYVKSVPFEWNRRTQQFEKCKKSTKFVSYLNVIIDFCWRTPTTFLSIYMVFTHIQDISKLIVLGVYLIGSILMAGSLTISCHLYGSDMLAFTNSFLQIDSEFKRMLSPKKPRNIDILLILVRCLILSKIFISLSMIPLLLRPGAFENFYLYLGGESLFGRICVAIIQAIIIYNSWNIVLLFGFISIAHVFSTTYWLDLLVEKLQMKEITFQEATYYYRSLVLCNQMYRNAFSIICLPIATIVLNSVIILSTFSIVMYYSSLDFASLFIIGSMGIMFVFIETLFIRLCNLLREKSEEFLTRISTYPTNVGEVLSFKSLPKLQAYVDPFFAYSNITHLTIFRFNLDMVITLIFLYRE